MKSLTQQQQRCLEALACFRYLTAHQLINLGVSKNINSLRDKTLTRLVNHRSAFIKSHDFGWIPQYGRLAKIYFLTKNGANLLADVLRIDPDTIIYPKGGIQFSSDYLHRTRFIDVQIAFRRWAEQTQHEILFFHRYFDKIGSQRAGEVKSTAKTRVLLRRTVYTEQQTHVFIPDGLTQYQDATGNRRLLAIELHNGTHSQRITEQLLNHLEALAQGLFSEKYHYQKANFVLSIHEHQSTLDSVRKRLIARPEFTAFLPLFVFNTQAQVNTDFAQGWTNADGKASPLFIQV